MRKVMRLWITLLFLAPLISGLAQASPDTEGSTPSQTLTEQETVTGKLFANLEALLTKQYFDYRKRPVIRLAIFDFTDSDGNTVKSGQELADKLTKRLYSQSQFDVVSRENINRYLEGSGLTALGKIDAGLLAHLQRRINTMDPANGIHALVTGEIQKAEGRSIRLTLVVTNFTTQFRPVEIEKNILECQSISSEIPLPTEQAVQEATEVVVRGEIRPLEEGRLVILANTRGNNLVESEYMNQFGKENPFPWGQVPFILVKVREKEEPVPPEQIRIGLDRLLLTPMVANITPGQKLDYSFLHGKCATNAVFFDKVIPARNYHVTASFFDLKNSEPHAGSKEVQVYAGTTTIVVVSFITPIPKEGTKGIPPNRIRIFQILGKGINIF